MTIIRFKNNYSELNFNFKIFLCVINYNAYRIKCILCKFKETNRNKKTQKLLLILNIYPP